jgi:aminomethyltransferase
MNKTTLHHWHVGAGARMGAFAGYDMPLFYPLGSLKEHEYVRAYTQAGAFDISHMGQFRLSGKGALELLHEVTPSFFGSQTIGNAKYSLLLNDDQNIIDDIIVTKFADDDFFIVVNAGTKDKDFEFLKSHLNNAVKLEAIDRDLIAIQGSGAESVLSHILKTTLDDLYFMQAKKIDDMIISRLGYTGEDGFEISLPRNKTIEFWNKILQHDNVKPIGLAARDSLRLEMGYSLYGHDIDESKTPLEADLGFAVSIKNPRSMNIPKPQQKRIGFVLKDKGIPREGMELFSGDTQIGILTSGGYSPILKIGIGMGYAPLEYIDSQNLTLKIRDNFIPIEITNLPFIPARVRRKL